MERDQLVNAEASVLHIAPEAIIQRFLQPRCKWYKTLDLFRDDVDLKEPLEKTSLADGLLDHIMCSHVLEHVDDRKALQEMFRLLRRGGSLFIMVPIVEGWDATYEDPSITTTQARELHFGQGDHVRFYGRDFRTRLREAGFSIEEITANEPDVTRYGLQRGEKLFVCTKP
ncbi:MAG: methyltransferase domain-containing protein [Betaproteobacteria bacterium]